MNSNLIFINQLELSHLLKCQVEPRNNHNSFKCDHPMIGEGDVLQECVASLPTYIFVWCAVELALTLAALWRSNVHNVLFSVLPSSGRLMPMAYFTEPIHLIFSFSVFLLLSIFPSITVFSKDSCLPIMCWK